jgi:hypothetical protein
MPPDSLQMTGCSLPEVSTSVEQSSVGGFLKEANTDKLKVISLDYAGCQVRISKCRGDLASGICSAPT